MASFQDIINSDTPVLVDFYGTWCAPCQTLAPILKEVAEEVGDKVRVIKVDVDKNQAAASHFQVRGVPTLILFKKGEIKWRQAGVVPKDQLVSVINEYA